VGLRSGAAGDDWEDSIVKKVCQRPRCRHGQLEHKPGGGFCLHETLTRTLKDGREYVNTEYCDCLKFVGEKGIMKQSEASNGSDKVMVELLTEIRDLLKKPESRPLAKNQYGHYVLEYDHITDWQIKEVNGLIRLNYTINNDVKRTVAMTENYALKIAGELIAAVTKKDMS
jgi:hypothetical protein